jgi:hypothetical protein
VKCRCGTGTVRNGTERYPHSPPPQYFALHQQRHKNASKETAPLSNKKFVLVTGQHENDLVTAYDFIERLGTHVAYA